MRLETQPEQAGAKDAAASDATDGKYAGGQAAERAELLCSLRELEKELSVVCEHQDVEFDFHAFWARSYTVLQRIAQQQPQQQKQEQQQLQLMQ